MPIDKNADNIQVMVRVRPLSSREHVEDLKPCVLTDESNPHTIILDTKPEQKVFTFDWVGGEHTTQEDVFNVVGKPMIEACLKGYNCCIFAYGQTGAGKTYTMQGRGFGHGDQDVIHRGLEPRVFDAIFGFISQEMRRVPEVQYLVSCSYLEIYNEHIIDLLDPNGRPLQIREDLQKGVYVEGLKEEGASTSGEIIGILLEGTLNRHVGSTNINVESSRSHSVFTMKIESKRYINCVSHIKTSKFHFVDLAGSERQKQTASVGERLNEARNINKSLLTLGQVINALVESSEGKQRHVRYRDSKLTFILKDSIGGNAKTCLIANISPASSAFFETLSTLKFAQRTKQIKNKALINEDASGSIEVLKKEIKRLREELLKAQCPKSLNLTEDNLKLSSLVNLFPESQKNQIQDIYNQTSRNTSSLESLLKQGLETTLQNELVLQLEIAKKEDYVNAFRSAIDFYEANELQYRSVISLYEARLQRLNSLPKVYGERIEMNLHSPLMEENYRLTKEKQYLMEIVKNTPTLMRVFLQNIEMREKLEKLERLTGGDASPNSLSSVGKHLQDHVALLRETISKIDEDMKLKKFLAQKIEEMQMIKQEEGGLDQLNGAELTISQMKVKFNDQIDKMNFKILDMKQKEAKNNRLLEAERKKLIELRKEHEASEEARRRNEEKYEIKLRELIQNFRTIEDSKTSIPNSGQVTQLQIQNLESKEMAQLYREKYQEMLTTCHNLEEKVKSISHEKDMLEKHYTEHIDKMTMEKGSLFNTVVSLENNMEVLMADFTKAKEEVMELSNKVNELRDNENDYKSIIERLHEHNTQLQRKVEDLEATQNNEVFRLQGLLEKEKLRCEVFESERIKIQEELDTLNSTLNYNINDLQENRQSLVEAQVQLLFQKTLNKELELKIQEQEKIIDLFKNHLEEPYKEKLLSILKEHCLTSDTKLTDNASDLRLKDSEQSEEIKQDREKLHDVGTGELRFENLEELHPIKQNLTRLEEKIAKRLKGEMEVEGSPASLLECQRAGQSDKIGTDGSNLSNWKSVQMSEMQQRSLSEIMEFSKESQEIFGMQGYKDEEMLLDINPFPDDIIHTICKQEYTEGSDDGKYYRRTRSLYNLDCYTKSESFDCDASSVSTIKDQNVKLKKDIKERSKALGIQKKTYNKEVKDNSGPQRSFAQMKSDRYNDQQKDNRLTQEIQEIKKQKSELQKVCTKNEVVIKKLYEEKLKLMSQIDLLRKKFVNHEGVVNTKSKERPNCLPNKPLYKYGEQTRKLSINSSGVPLRNEGAFRSQNQSPRYTPNEQVLNKKSQKGSCPKIFFHTPQKEPLNRVMQDNMDIRDEQRGTHPRSDSKCELKHSEKESTEKTIDYGSLEREWALARQKYIAKYSNCFNFGSENLMENDNYFGALTNSKWVKSGDSIPKSMLNEKYHNKKSPSKASIEENYSDGSCDPEEGQKVRKKVKLDK